jgi:hypothetical protein
MRARFVGFLKSIRGLVIILIALFAFGSCVRFAVRQEADSRYRVSARQDVRERCMIACQSQTVFVSDDNRCGCISFQPQKKAE